jgi:hypothetical protein
VKAGDALLKVIVLVPAEKVRPVETRFTPVALDSVTADVPRLIERVLFPGL